MKINRILPHFLTSEVDDEGKTKKCEKSFEQILREEQEKLMKIISEELETFGADKQVEYVYNLGVVDDSFVDDEVSVGVVRQGVDGGRLIG